jgi:hypothetical protein
LNTSFGVLNADRFASYLEELPECHPWSTAINTTRKQQFNTKKILLPIKFAQNYKR